MKSSAAVASLDPKARKQYIAIFGLHALESVSLAREENTVLWTDDLIVALLAQADFGVRRIWTQLAFKIYENTKRIDDGAYGIITAKLTAWNYGVTIWNPRDVIVAGGLCGWDVDEWPLKQCLRQFGQCPLVPAAKVGLALNFFVLLRSSACNPLVHSSVIRAVLDAIGDRRMVRFMLDQLNSMIDVPTAMFVHPDLLYWLRLR